MATKRHEMFDLFDAHIVDSGGFSVFQRIYAIVEFVDCERGCEIITFAVDIAM